MSEGGGEVGRGLLSGQFKDIILSILILTPRAAVRHKGLRVRQSDEWLTQ